MCFVLLPIQSRQPPSGGCVLKHLLYRRAFGITPAAFGRLCVETGLRAHIVIVEKAAAFGRLCVETTVSVSLLE